MIKTDDTDKTGNSVNYCCVCVIGLPLKANSYTITKIAFSTSGFFEELLTGKLISDPRAELYFDCIAGSISFPGNIYGQWGD